MRLLVLFDLPVKAKSDQRRATQFRNHLLKDGFSMLQFSVY
ncbi:MAG: CRISPR-associated endonuclease Cas2, partial [Helicobacteraceae bacterium]|nr:CRISPR-associated endonuclease Cas2 [Helicobacteraceae bacterium]